MASGIITTLVLAALAVYGLARSITQDEGPFGAFEAVRDGIQRRFPDTWLARGIECPYCVGFWLSWAIVGLARLNHPVALYVLLVLSVWGVVSLLIPLAQWVRRH